MRSRLTIEYDGTDFAGWARQPGRRTVQDELERALATILGAPVATTVAGRTDAGVHAWGQVAGHDGESLDPARLNGLLPADIAVLDSRPAADGFDARRDAVSRTYCYRLLARRTRSAFERTRAHWWPGSLERDALHGCAAALAGRHDFTAFTPSETEHRWFRCDVRDARWREDGDLLEFWIEADMFLRHMVRVLVGTMLDVASGLSTVDAFAALLDGAPRAAAGRTAPARGLALARVAYDEGH
ncbi:MAG TPA: tRNA pseudouridine(38-40) synthase TruA [Solirubrobacteraceae bacterium]|nr:tRNA pseudouridine(38-40) synthase TruA [Solirubrobacteraceae bacterium]